MYKLQIITLIKACGLSVVFQNEQTVVCQSLDKTTVITIRTKKYGNSCHVKSLKKIQSTSNLDEKKLKKILTAIAAPYKKKEKAKKIKKATRKKVAVVKKQEAKKVAVEPEKKPPIVKKQEAKKMPVKKKKNTNRSKAEKK